MSGGKIRWPSFLGLAASPPPLQVERAVWGKVHGQSSEFRWIARSPGLVDLKIDLEKELSLGTEDVPHHAVCWRALGDRYVAVHVYPSRARDEAGRWGFLEKQLLVWKRHPEIPAAFAACLLLPRVANLDDQIWWTRQGSGNWHDRNFTLDLPAEEIVDSGDLASAAIERGIEVLQNWLGPAGVARFYEELEATSRPIFLPSFPETSLLPEALAALLLQLAPEIAGRLSLAGGLPSSRPDVDDLARCWDVVVAPAHLLPLRESPGTGLRPANKQLAIELLANRPRAVALPTSASLPVAAGRSDKPAPAEEGPGKLPLDLAPSLETRVTEWKKRFADGPPPPGQRLPLSTLPAVPQELFEFAVSADRRFFDIQKLDLRAARPGNLAPSLRLLVKETEALRPPWAAEKQWKVKVDLLRQAAIRLCSELQNDQEFAAFRSGRL